MHVFTHTASQTPLISSGTPLGHDRSAVTPLPCPIACSSDSHTCHDSDAPCLPFPPPGMLPPSHTYMTFLFNCNSLHNEAAMVKHGNPQHFPSWLCFNLSSNYLAQWASNYYNGGNVCPIELEAPSVLGSICFLQLHFQHPELLELSRPVNLHLLYTDWNHSL